MATGPMPLPGKMKEATRKLLRKLLTDLASIPAWDVQPGGQLNVVSTMHLETLISCISTGLMSCTITTHASQTGSV